jgi:replication factor A1
MRNKVWTAQRGRPPGRYHSYDDIRLLEYLAKISVKHEIDSGKFFSSFLDAFEHEEATCGELSIECRVKTRDYAIFLITNSHKVVAQFPIPEHILAKTNPLKEFTYGLSSTRKSELEAKSNHYQIKDLRVGMKRVNIRARVLEVSQQRLVTTRFGFYANVANALITDETGTIQLPLWNKQINEIFVGDLIQVENANVIVFRGVRQLKVSRSGKVGVVKNS